MEASEPNDAPTPLLIPPRERLLGQGSVRVGRRTAVQAPAGCRPAADRLERALQELEPAGDGGGGTAIRAGLDDTLPGIDAFEVEIAERGINVRGNSEAALVYGLHTLTDLLNGARDGGRLRCERLSDHADFRRRGFYQDCARGKIPTVETLFALIDRLSRWRYNELQLYVETGFAFEKHPDLGVGLDPFTAADILAVRAYAAARQVRLVGSIASLGHMEWLLSLPGYTHLAELPGHHGYPGGTTLCTSDDRSLGLMRDLYAEYVPLFDADDFNICCDEPWEVGQGRSKEAAAEGGVAGLYIGFVRSLHRILTEEHGKRVNLWADVVLEHPDRIGEFPSDAVMLNWEYDGPSEKTLQRFADGRKIRGHGYPLMVCPGTNSWMTHGGNLDAALWNVRHFAAAGREQGAEGVLMTDWGDAGHRNSPAISLLPIAWAGAHAWNGAAVDEEAFVAHFCAEVLGQTGPGFIEALRELGRPPAGKPWSLYHGLVESATPPNAAYADLPPATPARMGIGLRGEWTDAAEAELGRVAARPERMPGLRSGGVAAGEAEELELAWDLDRLAAEKMLFERFGGGNRGLRDRLRNAAARLEALWLRGHRPSRLQDNLALLKAAAEGVART